MIGASARIVVVGVLLGGVLVADPAGSAVGPSEQSGRAWLARVPPLPSSAQLAYAQWTDDNGSLTEAAAFKAVESGLQQTMMATAMPGGAGQAPSGPVSPQDRERIGRIAVYPQTVAVQQGIQDVRMAGAALDQQWQADADKIDREALQKRQALPVCSKESGEPAESALRELQRSVGDQKVLLATGYLPKFQTLVQRMQTTVGPRIDYGDSAMAAWAQLGNAGMKAQLAPLAHAAQIAGLADVGLVEAFTQQISKKAAQAFADRKHVEVVFAQAKGC